MKITLYCDHNGILRYVEIDGKICVVPKCQKPYEPIQVARIVKNELSGNSGQLQSIDANKPNYIQLTNVHTPGMDRSWLELWEQIEIWYGDPKAKELGEDLLIRLQKSFNLTKK